MVDDLNKENLINIVKAEKKSMLDKADPWLKPR
jgi:hypothetical protein